MSSKLKKKTKKKPMSNVDIVYQDIQPKRQKIDDQIKMLGNSLAWIFMALIQSRYEFSKLKLEHLLDWVNEEKQKWNNDSDMRADDLVTEAKTSRSYIYESAKKVTLSQYFSMAGLKAGYSNANVHALAYFQTGFVICSVWIDTVLQKHFRLTKEQRRELFIDWVPDYADSWQRGYIDGNIINQQFIEELSYDMAKGESVG